MTQATLILPNLYLGGVPKHIDDYQYVICVGERPTYLIPVGKLVIVNPLMDSQQWPDEARIAQMAEFANIYSKIGPTLVHCTMGLNRSALVVALSLMKLGYPAKLAIDVLRERHDPQVLKNQTFVEFLYSQDGVFYGRETLDK